MGVSCFRRGLKQGSQETYPAWARVLNMRQRTNDQSTLAGKFSVHEPARTPLVDRNEATDEEDECEDEVRVGHAATVGVIRNARNVSEQVADSQRIDREANYDEQVVAREVASKEQRCDLATVAQHAQTRRVRVVRNALSRRTIVSTGDRLSKE